MTNISTILPKCFTKNILNSTNILSNMYESDNYIEIEVFLAGISKDNIKITYENANLCVEILETKLNEDYQLKEYEYPCGTRSFPIANIDLNESESSFNNGKLLIRLRKVKNSTNNTIEIK